MIAALGDSFNTGFAARPRSGDNPDLSWSTGTDPRVLSVFARLSALPSRVPPRRILVAADGSKIADLARQIGAAADGGSDYLTVQSGGNDICSASEVTRVTEPAAFRASLEKAFGVLRKRLPNARILLTSITDEARWNDAAEATPAKASQLADGTICDPQLDKEGRQSRARRRQIQALERRYNAILRDICASDLHCRYDGGAFFRLAYDQTDVAPTDAFHPSINGLARLAATAWRSSFDFTDTTAPRLSWKIRRQAGGLHVTIAATDGRRPAGVEFHLGNEPFATYTRPFVISSGERLTFRAVDRNGNISPTYTVGR